MPTVLGGYPDPDDDVVLFEDALSFPDEFDSAPAPFGFPPFFPLEDFPFPPDLLPCEV